jgi:hypothetical protein
MTTGRKDGFFREYEIEQNDTLYEFHRHIQDDVDFDEAQMAAFYTSDANRNKHTQYALFDMGDGAMDTIMLEDLINNKINYLIYTFDFFNNRSFLIEFIGEIDAICRERYPRTVDGKGNPPDQLIDRPVQEPLPIDDEIANINNKKKSKASKELAEEEYDEDNEEKYNDILDDEDLGMLSETNEV